MTSTLRVWDLASGETVRTLSGHTGGVRAVAVTPDGRQVVSGSGDKTLRVWDLASGETVRTLSGHTGCGAGGGGDAGRPPAGLRLRGQHAAGVGPRQRRDRAHPQRPHRRGARRWR